MVAERRQIIAEIIAEDKTKSVLASARRKTKRYRDDVEKLNDALTDEEKAALAAAHAVKKLSQEHKDAQPKIQGMKKGLEGIGISGEAMTSVYTLAGFALGKLAGKMLDFARGAAAAAIESSDSATAASERLSEEWKSLQVAVFDATIGIESSTQSMGEWGAAMKGATAIASEMADEIQSSGQTFEWWQGPLWAGEQAVIAVKNGLIDLGSVAEATKVEFKDLTQAQRELNAALNESKEFEAAQMRFKGMADFSNTFENRARANLTMAAGLKSGKGTGKGKGKGSTGTATATAGVGALGFGIGQGIQGAAEAAIQARADAFRRLGDASRMTSVELNSLGNAMARAFDEAEQRRESVELLNSAFQNLATDGIMMVTSALADMITQLVAGDFNLGNFGAALLGQFGSMLKTVGEGAIGLGLLFSGLKSGTLVTAPGAVIGIGAGLVATGAIMEGLAQRGQKSMTSGASGGGASAAINDAIASTGRLGNTDQDEGPRETVLMIDGREVRGYVVSTVRQATNNGELVPMSGDPL